MLKRYCDFCGAQIGSIQLLDRTSYTQWYSVTNAATKETTDICNECLTKIVKAIKGDN